MINPVDIINSTAITYPMVMVLTFVANMFPGIPEEFFMFAMGFYVNSKGLNPVIVMLIFIIGLTLSDIILYWLTRKGKKPVSRFVSRFEKLLAKRTQKVTPWQKDMIIFVSRFVMFFRWIGPVSAGWWGVSFKRFLIIDLVAVCIYVPAMIGAGMYFSQRFGRIEAGFGIVQNILGMVLGLVILVVIWSITKRRFLRRFSGYKAIKGFFGFTKITNNVND